MKLSTRSRYGLRAMMVLAMSHVDEPMMTKEIADRQNLPATYLEQLMLTLRKSGLVIATRGAKGGYVLARDAGSITLAQIVEALEGPLDIADCADVPNCCLTPNACALKEIFNSANTALFDIFNSITLAELAERQSAKELQGSAMYFI
ncbi:MAG: Rrf2 family transcriptional regulator [Armatimonadetes bacterium]|nr:Rrf2 family transcriptional regulator [Armatimonadota bacterium]